MTNDNKQNKSTPQPKQQPIKPPFYSNLIAGAVAGVIGASTVFPMDMVKTRLQNQKVLPDGTRQYNGILDCFKKIVRTEGGFRGLYKGISANMYGIIPEKALKLAVNDFFRTKFQGDSDHITLPQEVMAGGLAGFCQVVATNPMEIVKIRLQVSGLSGKKVSLKEVVSELGIRGLYKGTSSTLLRDVPFSMVYFSLYGRLKQNLTNENGEIGLPKILLAGISAGTVAAAISTPMDVVKTRIQASKNGVYKGIIDCTNKIYQTEGLSGFGKGILPRIFIISPLFGITLVVYEIQKKLYSNSLNK